MPYKITWITDPNSKTITFPYNSELVEYIESGYIKIPVRHKISINEHQENYNHQILTIKDSLEITILDDISYGKEEILKLFEEALNDPILQAKIKLEKRIQKEFFLGSKPKQIDHFTGFQLTIDNYTSYLWSLVRFFKRDIFDNSFDIVRNKLDEEYEKFLGLDDDIIKIITLNIFDYCELSNYQYNLYLENLSEFLQTKISSLVDFFSSNFSYYFYEYFDPNNYKEEADYIKSLYLKKEKIDEIIEENEKEARDEVLREISAILKKIGIDSKNVSYRTLKDLLNIDHDISWNFHCLYLKNQPYLVKRKILNLLISNNDLLQK